jgi:hypothetical protein
MVPRSSAPRHRPVGPGRHPRPVLLAIAALWLLLGLLVAALVATLGRAGLHEDRARGYLPDRP